MCPFDSPFISRVCGDTGVFMSEGVIGVGSGHNVTILGTRIRQCSNNGSPVSNVITGESHDT